MGTFILAFIGNSFVHSLSARGYARILPLAPVWRRRCLVLLYFTTIVSVVTLFGVLTIPDIIREGADFVSRLQSDNIWVVVLEKLRHGVGWVPRCRQSAARWLTCTRALLSKPDRQCSPLSSRCDLAAAATQGRRHGPAGATDAGRQRRRACAHQWIFFAGVLQLRAAQPLPFLESCCLRLAACALW